MKKLPSAEADAASQQALPVLKPANQIDFYARLQAVKERYLHDALMHTIAETAFDLGALDSELASFADATSLKRLASFHLRGETFFPVPYLLKRNAYVLGYYRLLYGFSCKAFYGQGPFKRFQRMEDRGVLDLRTEPALPALCRSLCATGGMLVDAIKGLSLGTVFELQLLTLGPQFKGGGNVKVGQGAIDTFFMLLKSLLSPYNPKVKGRRLTFVNDSKLDVVVRVASDPDVSVTQQLGAEVRKLVAIELKGGTDVSNIWNRLGEAEKSHLKAKAKGFNELWTVTRVDLTTVPALENKARAQSPSTTRFFFLDRIADPTTPEAITFRQVLGSMMGVRLAP
ncbi:MAG: XcyI family restriction endonuclease [Bryobacteraceae bacterium]|jgi:hypothetical protein